MQCHIHGGVEATPGVFVPHHVHPTSYGGSESPDNLVHVCGTCHDILHKIAEALYAGNTGKASDLANQYLPHSPRERQELMRYANIVAQKKRIWGERSDKRIPEAGEDDDDFVIIQLKIPRWVHHRLKTLAASYFHSNKKRVGLYAYIIQLLTRHVELELGSPGTVKPEDKIGMGASVATEETDLGCEMETWELP